MYIDKLPTVIPESVFDVYDSHVKWQSSRSANCFVYVFATSTSAEPWASGAVVLFFLRVSKQLGAEEANLYRELYTECK